MKRPSLLTPWALAAIAVMVINDHWLKALAPGLVTGKLSDMAGLAFFPLFLVELARLPGFVRRRHSDRSLLLLTTLLTMLVFAAVKTVPLCAETYRVGLGLLQWPLRALAALLQHQPAPHLKRVHLCRDATDLIALPFATIAVLVRQKVSTDRRSPGLSSP